MLKLILKFLTTCSLLGLVFCGLSTVSYADNKQEAVQKIARAHAQALQQKNKNKHRPVRGMICRTQIIVTKPQTVSFYADKIGPNNLLGTEYVGKWLKNSNYCFKQGRVIAVTWDQAGHEHHYITKKKITNINRLSNLQFPRDFTAPVSAEHVMCRARIFNNSKYTVLFYGGEVKINYFLAKLRPWQSTYLSVPCFVNKPILARVMIPHKKNVSILRYQTPINYSDLNHVVAVSFPGRFTQQPDQLVPLVNLLVDLMLPGFGII